MTYIRQPEITPPQTNVEIQATANLSLSTD